MQTAQTSQWLKLADHARAIAHAMQDVNSKKIMLEIAGRYEIVAALHAPTRRPLPDMPQAVARSPATSVI